MGPAILMAITLVPNPVMCSAVAPAHSQELTVGVLALQEFLPTRKGTGRVTPL
jgi:hypothetical protein